jgi:hypothetical protein
MSTVPYKNISRRGEDIPKKNGGPRVSNGGIAVNQVTVIVP